MRPSATVAAMLLSMIACASAAQAQSVGVQGGVSRNPDQVYAGVQVESSPVRRHLTLRPALQAGAGEGTQVVTGHLDFIVRPQAAGSNWAIYLGAGPSVNAYGWKDSGQSQQETNVGGTVVIGLDLEEAVFFELRAGLGKGPHLKLGIGFTFGR